MPITPYAHVDDGWSIHGQPALVLTNGLLRVVVLPGLGGRIWQVTHLPSGCDLLWNHPLLAPAPVPFGTGYDDNFQGGWDELFPNDLPELLAGEAYPDHGELWTSAWSWEVLDGDAAAVRLRLITRISACEVTRTISLRPGEDSVEVAVSVSNRSGADLPMLHKQHLAVPLRPGARLDLPDSRITLGDFGRPRAGRAGDRFRWPSLDGVDFRPVPPAARRLSEFLFADDLAAGWCAVSHPDRVGIGLAFDPAAYPSCWVFASYGGWRNLEVIVLEPCTGVGLSVADGVASGQHRVLGAGAEFTTTVRAVVLPPGWQPSDLTGAR